jgi:effector-binding domain-containing protein
MGLAYTEDYSIGGMRVLTLPECTLLCVRSEPTPFAELGTVFEPLIKAALDAQEAARLHVPGPLIVRYYPAEQHNDLYTMEVGFQAAVGTLTKEPARILTTPLLRCAALLLWGSLAHMLEAYDALHGAVDEAGLEPTGECREMHYWFEGDDSPRNLFGLYMGVK